MYLLGLRALGHEVFYIEDTGECVYDPVQNTRSPPIRRTARPTSTTRSRRSGSATAGRSSTTTAAITARRAAAVRESCGERRPVHQPVRRLVVLARRVRAHPAQGVRRLATRRSRSSRSPRRSRGTSSSSSASIACSPSAPTSARRRPTDSGRRLHVAQDLAADHDRRLAHSGRPAPRDSLHAPVMTWQIESFTDVGGNKDQRVREVHRPAVADAAAVRAGDQRTAEAAARTRLGDGGRDAGLAHAVGVSRVHPALEGRVRRRQTHLRGQPHPAGSAIARSAIWRRAARRSCRTPAGPRICRPAKACWRSRRSTRPSPASIGSMRGLRPARAAARRRDRRASTSTPRSRRCRGCCRRRYAMRIAHVAPVATTIPPPKSGSVETMTSLLTEGLVARGHDVTLFATGDSQTTATLAATYPQGYWHDLNMWPWELCEMLNLAHAGRARARSSTSSTTRRRTIRCRSRSPGCADADRADAASFAERRRGQALVALSRSAVRRHLQRAGAPAARRQRRGHGAARHRHRPLHVS